LPALDGIDAVERATVEPVVSEHCRPAQRGLVSVALSEIFNASGRGVTQLQADLTLNGLGRPARGTPLTLQPGL